MTRIIYTIVFVLFLFYAKASLGKEWAPGVHKDVLSVEEATRTFSVFIPGAYKQDGAPLPVLFLSMPRGNPKLDAYQPWAEKRGVILIGINSSRNGPTDNNIRAQDLVLKTLEGDLPIRLRLYLMLSKKMVHNIYCLLPQNIDAIINEKRINKTPIF